MKQLPHPLLVLLVALPLLATGGESPAPQTARLSAHLTEALLATLPAFNPTAAQQTESPAANPLADDVVVLPKYTVRDRRLPRAEADDWLSQQALAQKIKRDYLNSLNPLDRLLNGFSIPFLTPSVAARAAAQHDDDKRRREQADLDHLLDVVGAADPDAAAALRSELTRR